MAAFERIANALGKATESDYWLVRVGALLEAVAFFRGLPVTQPKRTIGYGGEVATDAEDPENIWYSERVPLREEAR